MLPDTTGIEPTKSGFAPLPEGEYTGRITAITDGFSQENAHPFLNFEVTITDGEYAGRKVWRRIFLEGADEKKTRTLLGMYAGFLESLGMSQEQRHATRDLETLRNFAQGMAVTVYIKQKEYNGKISNEIAEISPADGGDFNFQ